MKPQNQWLKVSFLKVNKNYWEESCYELPKFTTPQSSSGFIIAEYAPPGIILTYKDA